MSTEGCRPERPTLFELLDLPRLLKGFLLYAVQVLLSRHAVFCRVPVMFKCVDGVGGNMCTCMWVEDTVAVTQNYVGPDNFDLVWKRQQHCMFLTQPVPLAANQ
eukprot:6483954-Amphidinium_carterae.2